jgi:hypothetical protein
MAAARSDSPRTNVTTATQDGFRRLAHETPKPHRAGSGRTVGKGSPEVTQPTGPPAIVVRVDLEDTATTIVLADSFEDERRVAAWASSPFTRRRIVAAVDAALHQLAERHAA